MQRSVAAPSAAQSIALPPTTQSVAAPPMSKPVAQQDIDFVCIDFLKNKPI